MENMYIFWLILALRTNGLPQAHLEPVSRQITGFNSCHGTAIEEKLAVGTNTQLNIFLQIITYINILKNSC